MRQTLNLARVAALGGGVAVVLGAAACGGDDDDAEAGERTGPTVVVTTNILGDIVRQVVGGAGTVEVIMPLGADPHDFAASARQAESMGDADLLVVNGAGFEEGMADLIERVTDDGTETFAVADEVAVLPGAGHDDDEDHTDDDGDGAADPHVWTDPSRMAEAVEALGARLATLDTVDADDAASIEGQADRYAAALRQLDADIDEQLAGVPAERRVLVTNHEVLAYFADRYGFEVLGAVIPSSSTSAAASAAGLDELAGLIRDTGVPAIFAETTGATDLAVALADEVGSVEVVELFTESLGEPGSGAETYVDMMRTNADLVAGALA